MIMSSKKLDIENIVYRPEQAGALAVDFVDDLRQNKDQGVKTDIADLDAVLVPLRGWLVTVLGYTSNMKSTWMDWLGLQALKTIKPTGDECVIKVTWEQSVEEDTLAWMAANSGLSLTRLARGMVDESEWTQLKGASVRRATTPLWVIGHSQMEYQTARRARPRMTMEDVKQAIEYIIHDSTPGVTLTPRMIVLDYLQRMRSGLTGASLREQMMENVNQSKDLTVSYGCPVVLGVQAGREAADRMPTLEDGQETSNIEQSSDVSFGCWYPIKTHEVNTMVEGFKCTKNLFFLRLLKQKLGESSKTFPLYVDPERRMFKSMKKDDQPNAQRGGAR